MNLKLVVLTLISRISAQSLSEISIAENLTDEYFKSHPTIYPKMVRFAFHSCVGDFGCNGCLNIEHPDNKGLEKIFADLNEIYDKTTGFSRADFWALAGLRVLDFVKPGKSENLKEYTFGRQDCESSPFESDYWEYPNPREDWNHVVEIFGENSIFRLDSKEIVALIGGAHSLGRPKMFNSGFEKPWDPSTTGWWQLFY